MGEENKYNIVILHSEVSQRNATKTMPLHGGTASEFTLEFMMTVLDANTANWYTNQLTGMKNG